MTDTAFVKDAKGWKFAEDSRISKAQEKDIVVSLFTGHILGKAYQRSPAKHICCMSCSTRYVGVIADEQVL